MTTITTTIKPPARLPKTADLGDARYYEWHCPECQAHWQGSYHQPAAYDNTCTEPYTLLEDGRECGSFSYETAKLMHDDFRLAVAEHTCQPQQPAETETDEPQPTQPQQNLITLPAEATGSTEPVVVPAEDLALMIGCRAALEGRRLDVNRLEEITGSREVAVKAAAVAEAIYQRNQHYAATGNMAAANELAKEYLAGRQPARQPAEMAGQQPVYDWQVVEGIGRFVPQLIRADTNQVVAARYLSFYSRVAAEEEAEIVLADFVAGRGLRRMWYEVENGAAEIEAGN